MQFLVVLFLGIIAYGIAPKVFTSVLGLFILLALLLAAMWLAVGAGYLIYVFVWPFCAPYWSGQRAERWLAVGAAMIVFVLVLAGLRSWNARIIRRQDLAAAAALGQVEHNES